MLENTYNYTCTPRHDVDINPKWKSYVQGVLTSLGSRLPPPGFLNSVRVLIMRMRKRQTSPFFECLPFYASA